ncbi:hypothetical protein SEUCBS140593_001958 [Sporothrix eucalyptigena]|uniref:Carboxylic ester hydrolase n=1 Tax=Sporothrix eucalyptigena TaxID=1812306 RepID=A0ABP0B2N0_9PEZI
MLPMPLALAIGLLARSATCYPYSPATIPTVTVVNGSYTGLYNTHYDQDFFLGMPYAQPPVGDLRFRVAQPLDTTWNGTRNATQYSYECYGYSSDDWVLGNPVSEDCLTINVVRPHGISEQDSLPVAFWIYGGGFTAGGSLDPRYNLSYIVQQSVEMDTPMIGVSINYRVQAWGFLHSQELVNENSTNMGLRDQRLGLHWVQENIAAFGGDPKRVTIWGQSAGAESVGYHLVAYGGRDDGLFARALSESGTPVASTAYWNVTEWQPVYDAVVNATNCSGAADSLSCLRNVPAATLNNVFNSTTVKAATFIPVIDGDIVQRSGAQQLLDGDFVKVPYLLGTNFDEGTQFTRGVINTTDQFLAYIKTFGPNDTVAETLAALYPDIPAIGIPATLDGRPPESEWVTYGKQWKRAAAFTGDLKEQSVRRFAAQAWAQYNVSAYSYHFDVRANGDTPEIGSTHFVEVAFVFHNTQGNGYKNVVAVDPFEGEPETFFELATLMSRMWVSFVNYGDPNYSGVTRVKWPVYSLDTPQNIVFDVNVTNLAYIEDDYYRAPGMAYIEEHLTTSFGR